jgi:hypothetical protein
MNSNDVLTQSSDGRLVSSPAQASGGHLGAALDALNLGIPDLGSNNVVWSGLNVTCQNENGAKLLGHLELTDQGIPASLELEHHYGAKLLHFRVSYEFDKRRDLPNFFPSRIKLERITPAGPAHVSDYDIAKLRLTNKDLTFADVDYASWTNARSKHFISVSNATYLAEQDAAGAPKLTRLIEVPIGAVKP